MAPESVQACLTDRRLLAMVRSEARRFGRSANNREDLYQAGILGALLAFKAFDPTVGVDFVHYARFVVREEIGREARRSNTIVLSKQVLTYLSRADRERLKPGASREEVARAVGVSVNVLNSLAAVSYDADVDVPDAGEHAWSEAQIDREMVISYIQSVMDDMEHENARKARLVDVLRRHYGMKPYEQPQGGEEIGAAHGVGPSRVSQLKAEAISLLKSVIPVEMARALL